MLRPCERSFNSGQMLRKLSPLNSTFDKSHYSLLSRAPYRSCIHFSDLYPHPSSLSLSLFFFSFIPSVSLFLFFSHRTSVSPASSHQFRESSLDEWQYTKDVHTRRPTKLKSDQSLQIDVSIFKRQSGRGLTRKTLCSLPRRVVSSPKRLCVF